MKKRSMGRAIASEGRGKSRGGTRSIAERGRGRRPPHTVDLDAVAVDGASSSSSSTTTLSLGGTAPSAPARAEKMKTTRAAFERVVVPEAVSREGEGGFVREGVRVMTIAPDGASVYVGMTNGVVKQILANGDVGARAMQSFYPTPVNAAGDEFNNANTPVRMFQISKASGEALVGYENGGWSKVSLDNGETTTWSAPHSDFADVFKYVNVKKAVQIHEHGTAVSFDGGERRLIDSLSGLALVARWKSLRVGFNAFAYKRRKKKW